MSGICRRCTLKSRQENRQNKKPNNNGKYSPTTEQIIECMTASFQAMNFMRTHQRLTDIVLEVESELFYAHRIVLASTSRYFEAMFTSGLKESTDLVSRIKLGEISAKILSVLLDFMYTGSLVINQATICPLLAACSMLQMSKAIKLCCDFLEYQLDASNAIGIATFAEQNGCFDLQRIASEYIELHFSKVCESEEFLELMPNQLISLIKKDEINVRDERDVYNSAVKWVRHDAASRRTHMETILNAVRCQFLPPKFLRDQLTNCEIIWSVPACHSYLTRIFKDLTLHIRSRVRERRINAPRFIYVVGGYMRQSLPLLEAYNVDTNRWIRLKCLPEARSGLGAVSLKGNLYALGGRFNKNGNSCDSNWIGRYSPIENEWEACEPLTVARNRLGVAVLDGLLCAIGGCDTTHFHDTAECYDPDVNRWHTLASMHCKRLALGVAVVNRLLYAVGGYDGVERHRSVECYRPEINSWSIVAPMTTPRSGVGVVAVDKYIYAIGGYDGEQQLASVERYDTEQDGWMFVASLRVARSAFSVAAVDGRIYVMGGYDGSTFLNMVEIYDVERNVWTDGWPLTLQRSGLASAVSYHICNEYTPENDTECKKMQPVTRSIHAFW